MQEDDRYRTCFQAIEKELDRRGLDWTIHGLPGADDIIHFEEYWLLNTPVSTKLFPAILDADSAKDLDGMIVRAVNEHAEKDDTTVYRVVLCGAGWTEDRVAMLRRQVESRLKASIELTIESIASFSRSGGPVDPTAVP
jgi:hypothetical protein